MLSSGHWALYMVICIGVIVGISYFLVVFVDDRFHVVHTAVANFDVILVEKAVVFVLFREKLRNKRIFSLIYSAASLLMYKHADTIFF